MTLALAAALVPIGGSLWVAIEVLFWQAGLRHEKRVRVRLQPIVEEARVQLHSNGTFGLLASFEWASGFEERLLLAHGVNPTNTTFEQWGIEVEMSGPVMPLVEWRGQVILVISSLIGVVLLALDALPG